MNHDHPLELELEEFRAPVYILKTSTEVSAHTGCHLHVLHGEVRVNGRGLHESFSAALAAQPTEGIWSHDHPDIPRQRWIVTRGSYSVSNERYVYQVILREVENLQVESLVVDDIVLTPHRYEEQTYGGAITTIKAMVRVSGDDATRLAELILRGGYFPVIRNGISEAPLEGRFGMCGWSEHGEMRKYALIIVPRERDESTADHSSAISTIAGFNEDDALAYNSELIEGVLRLLIEKQLLTDSEVEEVRGKAGDEVPSRVQKFLEVRDADDLRW